MPLRYIQICSRCNKRQESATASLPNQWVEAKVDVSNTYIGRHHGDAEAQPFTWCDKCWRDITTAPLLVVPLSPLEEVQTPVKEEDETVQF